MIGVNIISIAQSVNLSSGKMDNILVLQLPDGTEVNAIVQEEVVDRVFKLANGGVTAANDAPAASIFHPPPPPEAQPVGPPTEFNWMQLPESDLPMMMKSALAYLNVPHVLTPTALRNLIGQVNDRFGEEEWAEVLAKYPDGPTPVMPQQQPQQPPQPPLVRPAGLQPSQVARPAIGQVQWADGSPIVPGQGNRGRTVPANEAGWPIVQDGSRDPGEVVGGGEDVDEDGVGQF